MIEAEEYKNRVIWQLAGKLSSYLHSDKGRTEILNPPERRRITSIPLCFLREEVFTRIHIGINRWCESKDVLIVIQEIQCKMTNLLSEIQLIIHNIEKDITGFARSIHDVSLSVFTRPELSRTLLNNGLALIEMITIPFLDDIPLVQRMIEKRAKTIYDRWLSTFSNTHIQRSFEENFGTEYDKVITRIFKNEIPIKVVLFNLTICKLLEELSDNKKKKESLTRLDELVQNINTQIEEFKEATNI